MLIKCVKTSFNSSLHSADRIDLFAVAATAGTAAADNRKKKTEENK